METFIVTTEAFVPLVQAQARARGAHPKMLVIKHPVGGLSPEELTERIEAAYAALVEALERPTGTAT